ncbi:MAG: hypothetical protein UHK60_10010 [Acutalibacteraceae bacterium]|nr:hypothetical protein [Acutalibacteraceae bacterium]
MDIKEIMKEQEKLTFREKLAIFFALKILLWLVKGTKFEEGSADISLIKHDIEKQIIDNKE